jgi:hypothetical protein
MNNMIIIPAIYEGSRDLRDRTKKLTFGTNEITPEQAANLQMMVQEYCYLAIKMEPFTGEQQEIINDLKSDIDSFGKSPGQRMRGVLYRLWEQSSEGYVDFNLYYNFKMEQLISHLKTKLHD